MSSPCVTSGTMTRTPDARSSASAGDSSVDALDVDDPRRALQIGEERVGGVDLDGRPSRDGGHRRLGWRDRRPWRRLGAAAPDRPSDRLDECHDRVLRLHRPETVTERWFEPTSSRIGVATADRTWMICVRTSALPAHLAQPDRGAIGAHGIVGGGDEGDPEAIEVDLVTKSHGEGIDDSRARRNGCGRSGDRRRAGCGCGAAGRGRRRRGSRLPRRRCCRR